MTNFKKLGLSDAIAKSIERKGITEPTKIQSDSIPLILKGYDLIGESATGSGKTLAFGTGILQNTRNSDKLSSLVLTPTREIAHQVREVIEEFSHDNPKNVVSIYGGVAIGPQIDKLETANIVIGTPGRILDHLQRGTLNLKDIQMLVLDEADKMFEMGFIDDIKKIMSQCNPKRQTLLYSATFSKEIQTIANRHMHEPKRIKGEGQVDPTKLKQVYYNTTGKTKFSVLVHLLQNENSDLVLVFANTKRMVDTLQSSLKQNGVKSMAIHGGLTQAKRQQSLDALKNSKVEILICTDVAARGLDIPDVSHVYNYDVPPDSKDYIHRIGRTARAGSHGKVINILSRNDFDNFGRVLNDYRDIKVECIETPKVDMKDMVQMQRSNYYGGNRDRSGGSSHSRGRPNRSGSSRPRNGGPRRGSSNRSSPRR